MPPYSKNAKYIHKVIEDKNNFDPRSFRVITLNETTKATIGCPKGKWSPSKNKCKVGTRIQKKLILKKKFRE